MTTVNPQEVSLILILGEMRGDLKNIATSLSTMDTKISTVEEAAHSRHDTLEGRVSSRLESLEARITARLDGLERRTAVLETVKTRIGAVAVAAGLFAGVFSPKLSSLLQFVIGG